MTLVTTAVLLGAIFDGLTFLLTLGYAFSGNRTGGLTRVMVRDGALYFFVVFASELTFAAMILKARVGPHGNTTTLGPRMTFLCLQPGIQLLQAEPNCL